MITGIRSALICSEVRRNGQTSDYIGVWGDPLVPATTPGVLSFWVAVQVSLDEKATSGQLRVYGPDVDRTVPFNVEAGWRVCDISSPFIIPILSEGALTVAVIDDKAPGKPFRAKWSLMFHPGAPSLNEAEMRTAAANGDVVAAELMAAMARKRVSGS